MCIHFTWSALTTLIWCSSPRAWTQWWNKLLMLSLTFMTSSPSRDSNFPSRYSRFTWSKHIDISHMHSTYSCNSVQYKNIYFTFIKKSSSQNRGLFLVGSSFWWQRAKTVFTIYNICINIIFGQNQGRFWNKFMMISTWEFVIILHYV